MPHTAALTPWGCCPADRATPVPMNHRPVTYGHCCAATNSCPFVRKYRFVLRDGASCRRRQRAVRQAPTGHAIPRHFNTANQQ
ncbi:hypothetical protein E2C01_091324 [Portunus trituberculatus]|uniref:Uncharacterized protein n=1 Tax=Portunus trituberculatus TaxID=210409 RepID=A0A5B7JN96_PORTR|nr:hypothetical protein [Portunus trituberculatus]